MLSTEGFEPWQVEVYEDGLVAFAKELSEDTLIEQLTFLCRSGSGEPTLLMTARNANPSAGPALMPDSAEVPNRVRAEDGATFEIGSKRYTAPRSRVSERFTDTQRFFSIELPLRFLSLLLDAGRFNVSMDIARAFGFYHASAEIDDAGRKAIKIAMRNCI